MNAKKWIKRISLTVFLILTTGTAFHLAGYKVFRYQSEKNSMQPTISPGDFCLCTLKRYNAGKIFKTGDIVLLKHRDYPYLLTKRIIGVPFDTVSIIGMETRINGSRMLEPYVAKRKPEQSDPERDFSEIKIPEGFYFVMGDNRAFSLDSRDPRFGLVEQDQIVGKPLLFLWSKERKKIFRVVR
jgi:signal peptidase I